MDWLKQFFDAVRKDPRNMKYCIELAAFAYVSRKYTLDVSYIRWKKDSTSGCTMTEAKPDNSLVKLGGKIAPLLFMNKTLIKTNNFSPLISNRDFRDLFSLEQLHVLEQEDDIEDIERVVNGIKGNITAIPRIAHALYFEEPKNNGWRFLKKAKILKLIKEGWKEN